MSPARSNPNWPLSVSSSACSIDPQLGHATISSGTGGGTRCSDAGTRSSWQLRRRRRLHPAKDELLGPDAETVSVLSGASAFFTGAPLSLTPFRLPRSSSTASSPSMTIWACCRETSGSSIVTWHSELRPMSVAPRDRSNSCSKKRRRTLATLEPPRAAVHRTRFAGERGQRLPTRSLLYGGNDEAEAPLRSDDAPRPRFEGWCGGRGAVPISRLPRPRLGLRLALPLIFTLFVSSSRRPRRPRTGSMAGAPEGEDV